METCPCRYREYKKDTKCLVYWLINASNAIFTHFPASATSHGISAPNATGQTTVSGILAMSKLVSEHIDPVPNIVYILLRSIIKGREAANKSFSQLQAQGSDPELERSNSTHKHFIHVLIEAFNALGGEKWASERSKRPEDCANEDEDQTAIFSNRFSGLDFGDTALQGDTSDDETHPSPKLAQVRRQTRSGKTRRNKKGKKQSKKNKKAPGPVALSWEGCGILDDEGYIVIEYRLAVLSLARQWLELRIYLQSVWHDVAYHHLNMAVAAELTHTAIGLIKRSESAIFLDFPNHNEFETIFRTTASSLTKSTTLWLTSLSLGFESKDTPGQLAQIQDNLDKDEILNIYAYDDLRDFIEDFRKTWSGKPSRSMSSQIDSWDPRFDVQQATSQQRIAWRRGYTMNWLYDMVNEYLSPRVGDENHIHKGYHDFEWPPRGHLKTKYTLFGLNEFARSVTNLAMQKDGKEVRDSILPHHVFTLQCLVDSMTISRGWSLSVSKAKGIGGVVLGPPAGEFCPLEKIETFLGGKEPHHLGFPGISWVTKSLDECLRDDVVKKSDRGRHGLLSWTINLAVFEIADKLGISHVKTPTTPPSRILQTREALWHCSPFLCGSGLLEALEAMYALGLTAFDLLPEITILIHLHNFLAKNGYTNGNQTIKFLEQEFAESFFADGKAPDSHFAEALRTKHKAIWGARIKDNDVLNFQQRKFNFEAFCKGFMNFDLEPSAGLVMKSPVNSVSQFIRGFRIKSLPILFSQVRWDPDLVSTDGLSAFTNLEAHRHAHKLVFDPASKEWVFKDTEFLRHWAQRVSAQEEFLMGETRDIRTLMDSPPTLELDEDGKEIHRWGKVSKVKLNNIETYIKHFEQDGMDVFNYLTLLREDFETDIVGFEDAGARSGICYMMIARDVLRTFASITKRLEEHDPFFSNISKRQNGKGKVSPMVVFADHIMGSEDDHKEAIDIIVEEFNNIAHLPVAYTHWYGLDEFNPETMESPEEQEVTDRPSSQSSEAEESDELEIDSESKAST